MLVEEGEEFVDIFHQFTEVDFLAVLLLGDGSDCGFEVAGGEIEPLVDQGSVVVVTVTVELLFVG